MAERVTIIDVARSAGVSIASVSAALNGRSGVSEETRARIGEVADRLGWVPSLRGRSLSQKRAFAVGLVIQRSATVVESDPFFAGFIGGVEAVLVDRGYALVLQVGASRSAMLERYHRLLLDHRIDGVFLTDIEDRDPRFAMLARSGTPAVAVNAGPDCPMPAVRQDHAPGLLELVDRVVALGHRRIAHVSGPPGFIHSGQRERVWRDALRRQGLRPGPVFAGDFSIRSGTLAADRLFRQGGRSPRPTAVVCANDLMALGFLTRAVDLGLDVPGELSVTGFDGIEFGAYARPSLTTVATSPHQLGAASARSLLASIEDGRPEDVEIEPTRLVLRDSLGPAKTA
jgi:DNA-binding LacI/PurR family transcriptional regulator